MTKSLLRDNILEGLKTCILIDDWWLMIDVTSKSIRKVKFLFSFSSSFVSCFIFIFFWEQINKKLNEQIKELANEKTKLRFCTNTDKKKYLEQLGYTDARMILKLRLNMTELKCNYKNHNKDNIKCRLCKTHDDTTEHLFTCTKIIEQITQPFEEDVHEKKDKLANEKLAKFLKFALEMKGIDYNKTIKENIGNSSW